MEERDWHGKPGKELGLAELARAFLTRWQGPGRSVRGRRAGAVDDWLAQDQCGIEQRVGE